LHQAISRLTTTLQLDRTRQQLARCSNGCLSAQSHDARFIDPQPKGDTEEGWIMPTNLIALIAQFLTPDMIARIASALGIDRTLAQKAIDAAIPAMLARLAGHASKPEGARQLSNVLAQQGPDALVNIRNAIDRPQKDLGESGWNLWSALLGRDTMNGLSTAVGKFAGLGEGTSKSLLNVLGPVVMGVLGQQQRSAGLDASGLAGLLASQKDQIGAAIPPGLTHQLGAAGLLDAVSEGARSSAAAASAAVNRIGSASESTVARAAQAATAARGSAMSQLPFWLVAIAVLAGLGWYFLRSHDSEEVAERVRQTATQPAEQARATTGLTTPNLSVGGVDLAKQVSASVGDLSAALTGITDAASAQAALPKIQEATAELNKVKALAAQLPPDSKRTLAGLIAAATPTIYRLCDKVVAMPGVGDVAKPAVDEVRTLLDTLTRA